MVPERNSLAASRPRHFRSSTRLVFFAIVSGLFLAAATCLNAERCATCNEEIAGNTVYVVTDKVANEKKHICYNCSVLADACFVCGMPVKRGVVKLSDGRLLCARDAGRVVLDSAVAARICEEVGRDLDKLLSRFLSLPTNVTVAVVDRVNLLALFKVPGNDFECPNILGYYRVTTNHNQLRHEISVMNALSPAELKETCAHEYGHAWVMQNVSEERKETLGHDAQEGFCELLGFLLMTAQGEEDQRKAILRNDYTRGQIDLFVEVEKRYGFSEILDWMRYGVGVELDAQNLNKVRDVAMPRPDRTRAPKPVIQVTTPPAAPDRLVLKGISGTKSRPLALINNETFAVGESGKVRVGKTNLIIRCLAVRAETVRIQVVGSGQELELSLSQSGARSSSSQR